MFLTYLFLLIVGASSDFVVNKNFMNSTIDGDNTLFVLSKHYEPFTYQNATTKQFYDGIEFKLLEVIAAKLKLEIEFIHYSEKFDEIKVRR